MNSNKKKAKSKKEEQKAKRLIKTVFISLIVLAFLMMVIFSVFA